MKKYIIILAIFLAGINFASASWLDDFFNFFKPRQTTTFGAGVFQPFQGGTGINTIPTYGKMLVGNSSGTYTLTATSSLGISGAGGEANTASTLGTGLNLFDTKSGVDLRFNSIAAGTNITLSTTSNNNTIVINSSGGSAISTSPNSVLVSDSLGTSAIASSSPTVNYITATSTTATSTFKGFEAGTNGLVYDSSSGDVWADAMTTFFVDSSANKVGFGTTTPPEQLTVGGTGTTRFAVFGGATWMSFGADPTDGSFYMWNSTKDLRFATGNTSAGSGFSEKFRMGANGNFGIGTSSPGTPLSVGNTGNSTINIDPTATSTFGLGLNIRGGCFAINGVCIAGTGGSGTVTSISTTFPIQGGDITTSGTLTFGGLSTSTAAVVGNIPYFSGVNTFANVATGTISAGSSAITVTAGRSAIGGALAIDCATAGSGQNGCLSSTDWTTFNNKGNGTLTSLTAGDGLLGGTITTSGTIYGQVGTSTIPTVGGLPYWTSVGSATAPAKLGNVATSTIGAGTGLSFSGTSGYQVGGTNGTFSVNTSQNIATLSNLTTNGYVKTSGGAGTLGVQAVPIPIADGGTNQTTFPTNVLIGFDGTRLIATGTPNLTAGYFTASSTSLYSTFPYADITTLLRVPRGTAPTMNNSGQLALDTTSNNLILATSTTGHIVIGSATTSLYAFSIASTSPDFASGGILEMPSYFLPQVVTAVWCKVDAGTSQQIFISDGTNDSNTVTCTTTGTQYAITSNNSFTAGEQIRTEFVTKSGSPDYLIVRWLGYRTTD